MYLARVPCNTSSKGSEDAKAVHLNVISPERTTTGERDLPPRWIQEQSLLHSLSLSLSLSLSHSLTLSLSYFTLFYLYIYLRSNWAYFAICLQVDESLSKKSESFQYKWEHKLYLDKNDTNGQKLFSDASQVSNKFSWFSNCTALPSKINRPVSWRPLLSMNQKNIRDEQRQRSRK